MKKTQLSLLYMEITAFSMGDHTERSALKECRVSVLKLMVCIVTTRTENFTFNLHVIHVQ
jgi:hypothetical protein